MYIMYIIENPIIFAFQNTPGPGQLPDHLATLLQEQKQRQVKGSRQVENGAIYALADAYAVNFNSKVLSDI